MKILFVGDIVGTSGQLVIRKHLANIIHTHKPQLTIVNGENITDGRGICLKDYRFLLEQGVDVVTLGNHAFDHRETGQYINELKCLVRPYNLINDSPGKGVHFVKVNNNEVAVVNLLGSVFMRTQVDPFTIIDQLINSIHKRTHHIIVDFHAEATSEKKALAYYLDGRISALIGTHTHIQTNDPQILPQGTAYITDVGMTGSQTSVLGFNKDQSIQRFLSKGKVKLETAAPEDLIIGAVIIDINNQTAKASKIKIIDSGWK